jgi:CDP-paratose 2-epimerase
MHPILNISGHTSHNMNTVCLRGGCLTGSNHSSVENHGFLSYLIKCFVFGQKYKVFGYKGKQVRDNIDSMDIAKFTEYFINSPKQGEVYNIGGGKNNSISILETFNYLEKKYSKKMLWDYDEQNRIGDHICYYSNLNKLKRDYPNWNVEYRIHEIIDNIYNSWKLKIKK